MIIYAGIDEAGYGPLLGPLVITRTVFTLQTLPDPAKLPCLWRLLQKGVCKNPSDKRKRIAINDSKILYSPGTGLSLLERGLLPFLNRLPVRFQEFQDLLDSLALDRGSRMLTSPWYRETSSAQSLPVHLSASDLKRSISTISRVMDKAGLDLVDLKAAVVFEDRFNRLVRKTGSKAGCNWSFVGAHLKDIWKRFGRSRPQVIVDRQGGRRYYGELLKILFPDQRVLIVKESFAGSTYEVVGRERAMTVSILVNADQIHLPVALASMTAKYVRELLMIRFQKYWLTKAPDIRPTFGYFGDGTRFLQEIAPLLEAMCIDQDTLVRSV